MQLCIALLLVAVASAASASPKCRGCSPFNSRIRQVQRALPRKSQHLVGRAVVLTEGFEVVPPPNWVVVARSNPPGIDTVFQGIPSVFPAQSGSPASYAGFSFNNVGGNGTISTWLISPPILIARGTTITFWTRAVTNPPFADRLEVRASFAGFSTNVGPDEFSVGDFTLLLLTVNPNLTLDGYPEVWTQYVAVIESGPTTPTVGRIAFRYFVTDAGENATNANYIGIDTVTVNTPEENVPVGTE